MRYFRLLLIGLSASLLPGVLSIQRAPAAELFADFLYWQATEPVDWVLETNRNPVDQYVTYRTLDFEAAPGLRVGVGYGDEWDTKFYYTHHRTTAADAAAGNLTAAFLGGKLAQPPSPKLYFDAGQIEAAIDYNTFDWDIGQRFNPAEAFEVRPLVGLRAGWIHQSIDSAFQAQYPGAIGTVQQNVAEAMRNNFWGIGPKVGIENSLCLWQGDECAINCVANFYTAYLLGQWQINDVTDVTTSESGLVSTSTKVVRVADRDFGALTFQAIVGVSLKYRCWSATVGYEFNDWLNQCQIFDDATGPHNNDLILQGLTVNVAFAF